MGKTHVRVSWPIHQPGCLDLEDVIYLSFEGLFHPCWGFDGLELLQEIFLDSDSI